MTDRIRASPKWVKLKASALRPSAKHICIGNGKDMILPPQTRELARGLLSYEKGEGKTCGPAELPFVRACERLRQPLIMLAGVAGFRSLLSRALTLARAEAPSLSAVQITVDCTLHGLDGLRQQVDADEAREAGIILITQLLGLLGRVVGEAITLHW